MVFWFLALKPNVKREFKRTEESSTSDNERARISIIRNHVIGNWRWLRYGIGCLLLVIFNVGIHSSAPQVIANNYGWSPDVVYALFFAVFISVVEGWMLLCRVRLTGGLSVLDELSSDFGYIITKKQSSGPVSS